MYRKKNIYIYTRWLKYVYIKKVGNNNMKKIKENIKFTPFLVKFTPFFLGQTHSNLICI